MLKKLAILLCSLNLMACNPATLQSTGMSDAQVLSNDIPFQSWWSFFSDPIVDQLVTSALSLNTQTPTQDTPESQYKDVRVGLVKTVVQNYLEYRYIQNQDVLLLEYIEEQTAALEVADSQSAKILEIELHALLERKEEFDRKLVALTENLADATRLLPEFIAELLKEKQPVPDYDLSPVFLTDTAELFAHSSQVRAALSVLRQETGNSISEEQALSVLPSKPLNQVLGVSDQIYSQSDFSWRVSIGQVVREMNFDLLSSVFYKEDIRQYEDAVTSYALNVERVFVGYATLMEQSKVLDKAEIDADESNIYKARLASLRADYERAKTVTELFDTLNLY